MGVNSGRDKGLAAWARIETGLEPDRLVLPFTLAVACVIALGFSLAPLRSMRRMSLEWALRSTSAALTQSRMLQMRSSLSFVTATQYASG